jgi:drug/metabolite transporter (DMT)-like permease
VLTATLLALAAAVLHAGWNLLVKTSEARDLAAWGQFLAGSALFLPVLVVTGLPGTDVAPFVAVSAVVHVVYVAALVAAYGHGDFSLVYPLARGSGALVAAIGGVLFLADDLGGLTWAAIAIVVGGLIALAGPGAPGREIPWACLTGLTIGTYSVLDAEGARRSTGLSYAVCLVVATAVGLTGWGLARGRGRAFVASWPTQWRRYLVGGACSMLAYALVLTAVRYAPVGYVAMLRESSIVIGAYAGWVLLGERLGRRRVEASVVITVGLVLLVASG